MPRAKNPATSAFRAEDPDIRRRLWINGHQIGMINALPRRRVFHVMKDDPALTELLGLTAAFAALFRSELRHHEQFDGGHDGVWVGGDSLRHAIQFSQITAGHVVFHDFGAQALTPIERAGLFHYPGLAVDGWVLSMSMPNPPPSPGGVEPQLGHKNKSWGKLLPGWHLESDHETGPIRLHGPAAPPDGIPLPKDCRIDDEGFVMCG